MMAYDVGAGVAFKMLEESEEATVVCRVFYFTSRQLIEGCCVDHLFGKIHVYELHTCYKKAKLIYSYVDSRFRVSVQLLVSRSSSKYCWT